MSIRLLTLLLVAALGFTACASEETETTAETTAPAETETETAPMTTTSEGPVSEITIEPVGNKMEFAQTEFTVEAGTEVTITFENTATSPAMQHNVVVLTSDDDEVVQRVGTAGMQAGAENQYVPEDEAVLAYTDMAKPGETVSVTFEAPSEPGTYTYVCTFPGHWTTMQGTMTVVPADGAA